PQELEGDDDDQHLVRAGDDRLRGEEPDEQPQTGVLAKRPEAGHDLRDDALRRRRRFLGRLGWDIEPGDEEDGPEDERGGDREDRSEARQAEQDPGYRRAEEEADALDRAA